MSKFATKFTAAGLIIMFGHRTFVRSISFIDRSLCPDKVTLWVGNHIRALDAQNDTINMWDLYRRSKLVMC